jgi:Domain of unknown function (DUF4160)
MAPPLRRPQEHKPDRVVRLDEGLAGTDQLKANAPPHFPVQYGEFQAEMAIETLQVLAGRLLRRALGITLEWAASHRVELFDDWELCRQHKLPTQSPLE